MKKSRMPVSLQQRYSLTHSKQFLGVVYSFLCCLHSLESNKAEATSRKQILLDHTARHSELFFNGREKVRMAFYRDLFVSLSYATEPSSMSPCLVKKERSISLVVSGDKPPTYNFLWAWSGVVLVLLNPSLARLQTAIRPWSKYAGK